MCNSQNLHQVTTTSTASSAPVFPLPLCLYDTPMLAVAVVLIDCLVISLAGPAGLMGLIAALTGATFLIARRHRSARPAGSAPKLGNRLQLWFGEIMAAWSLFLFWMPLERWLMPRDRPGTRAGAVPVLLIHGYINNAGALWRLWRALVGKGFGIYTLNLEPVYAGLDRYVPAIAARIGTIRALTGAAKVTLVCHSMGGLAARAYLDWCAAQNIDPGIAKVVTLGSPHHGTVLARAEWSENGRQMAPGSAWLARLAAQEAARQPQVWPCPFVSIYSIDDNVVVPQRSARLEGARNIELEGIGHISLPLAQRVIDLVLSEVALPPAS